MSKRSKFQDAGTNLDQQFERLAAAQQNLTPHDQLANGRSVDDAFWNGFEKPRGIQRAGLLVYSGTMLLIALAFIGIGYDQHQPSIYIMALLFTAIAVKVGTNAFRPRKKRLLD